MCKENQTPEFLYIIGAGEYELTKNAESSTSRSVETLKI